MLSLLATQNQLLWMTHKLGTYNRRSLRYLFACPFALLIVIYIFQNINSKWHFLCVCCFHEYKLLMNRWLLWKVTCGQLRYDTAELDLSPRLLWPYEGKALFCSDYKHCLEHRHYDRNKNLLLLAMSSVPHPSLKHKFIRIWITSPV